MWCLYGNLKIGFGLSFQREGHFFRRGHYPQCDFFLSCSQAPNDLCRLYQALEDLCKPYQARHRYIQIYLGRHTLVMSPRRWELSADWRRARDRSRIWERLQKTPPWCVAQHALDACMCFLGAGLAAGSPLRWLFRAMRAGSKVLKLRLVRLGSSVPPHIITTAGSCGW